MNELTPAMRQYLKIKEENPGCIVFFRMGDFYETFYEDAKKASQVLGITLTSRGKGEKRAPLAGIPYHALDQYLTKLVREGLKVALVEQLEDPKKAKGLVKRGLVRIVTPGTVMEDSILSKNSNNFIMAVVMDKKGYGLSLSDISTGEFICSETDNELKFMSEVDRFSPSEIVIPLSLEDSDLHKNLLKKGYTVSPFDQRFFWEEKAIDTIKEQFGVSTTDGFGLSGKDLALIASGALISYIKETQKNSMTYLRGIRLYNVEDYMIIDTQTLRNLELLKNMRDASSRGTLFEVINRTCTSMGARKLKSHMIRPILDAEEIDARLDSISELSDQALLREELREKLSKISDIERIIGRVTYGNANARDLIGIKEALKMLPAVKEDLKDTKSSLLLDIGSMDTLDEIRELIEKSIKEDPPVSLREGNIIQKGFDSELDRLKRLSTDTKSWISEFEEKERERTGIKSLKIRYNKVFGYFIEVTKSNLRLVPSDYIRKQTQLNAERFITEDLKEKESVVLGANEKICAMEYELFTRVIGEIAKKTREIQSIADKIAILDVLLSASQVAVENRYTRPSFSMEGEISIRGGRHPVIEKIETGRFVDNDTFLSPENRIHIITGPNMAGKSTYLRQVAHIVILAQMGQFVPAAEARLCIVDRIFSRVGAVDDLSLGQSTFMVEMTEAANILNNATDKSLIIMDEVGRGTSTYDGLSLAWAITEYIDDRIKAKTMFATHYHQLNRLAEKRQTIRNYNISVKEARGDIIFLRKIVEGGTDKSYGIHVAKLAGLPKEVIERARIIQGGLEDQETLSKSIAIDTDDDYEVKREIRITETVKRRKEQKTLLEEF